MTEPGTEKAPGRTAPPGGRIIDRDGPEKGLRAALIVPQTPASGVLRDASARLDEARGLVAAIGIAPLHEEIVRLTRIRPDTLFGTGKVAEWKKLRVCRSLDLFVIDHALSPIQQRNLEHALKARIVDRIGLILDIFGARAHSAEGRLQVEIARLTWQKGRLVRSWTHLERQRGGSGFLGGPGETQIEADRRQIGERIVNLGKKLERLQRRRTLQRRPRLHYPSVALAGYTNAGKSTLFNALSKDSASTGARLFDTLDPRTRLVRLPGGGTFILTDTVGFIADLPTQLIAAFRATLEEIVEADVILHVRDISHPDSTAQAEDVMRTLCDLDSREPVAGRIIEVWNKIDRIASPAMQARAEAKMPCGGEYGPVAKRSPVAISARHGLHLDALLDRIDAQLARGHSVVYVSLPVSDGRTLAWLYGVGQILRRHDRDAHIDLVMRVAPHNLSRVTARCAPYLHAGKTRSPD